MTRSEVAFRFSVETLFDLGKRVYMWTFTFRRVVDDEVAFDSWKHLNTILSREFKKSGDLPGIRVVEVHPGGHGLHFHVLIARRLPVEVVRRLAIRAGFGRIHVCKAKRSAALYLAKYLSKQDDGLKKGCRRWGMFGGFKGTRVKDIEIQSTLAENCRRVRDVLKTWGFELFVCVNKMTVRYGHILDWPIYPELAAFEEEDRSDNELPEEIKHEKPWIEERDGVFYGYAAGGVARPKPVFDKLRLFDSDLGEWVTRVIPSVVAQPF